MAARTLGLVGAAANVGVVFIEASRRVKGWPWARPKGPGGGVYAVSVLTNLAIAASAAAAVSTTGIIDNGMVAFGIGATGPIVVKKIARYVESLLPEAATAADALTRIPTLTVDVMVLDAHLPDRSGVDLSKDLLTPIPGVACLLLVPTLDDPAVLDAVVAGVYGVVPNTTTGLELMAAVRAAGEGDTARPADLLSSMLKQIGEKQRTTLSGSALGRLTTREREVSAWWHAV